MYITYTNWQYVPLLPGIYCQLSDYMLPTTYYGNQKQLSIGDGYMMYMLLMIFLFNLILVM